MLTCTKRRYDSPRAARRHSMKVHNRFRTYWCEDCRAFHITAAPKRKWNPFRAPDPPRVRDWELRD